MKYKERYRISNDLMHVSKEQLKTQEAIVYEIVKDIDGFDIYRQYGQMLPVFAYLATKKMKLEDDEKLHQYMKDVVVYEIQQIFKCHDSDFIIDDMLAKAIYDHQDKQEDLLRAIVLPELKLKMKPRFKEIEETFDKIYQLHGAWYDEYYSPYWIMMNIIDKLVA